MSRPSAPRKSRLDGFKPSLLPKPRISKSIDRTSSDNRRPSNTRSGSAEVPRSTFGKRLSRETPSAHKPLSSKNRPHGSYGSYGHSSLTPYMGLPSSRTTATPVRTPSRDRGRGWRICLERTLAFVTVKDQMPVSNVAWQREALARVAAGLEERGAGSLVRPLTIKRFVELTALLLEPLCGRCDINTDNYITKVPLVMKRLLYPGNISKSWLQTVNTLHAFPHALAMFRYLQDLGDHLETPLEVRQVLADKSEVNLLKTEYLRNCWIRFQEPETDFDDLTQEYLESLKTLLEVDEQANGKLRDEVEKYKALLEEGAEEDAVAEAEEAELVERVTAVRAQVRQKRRARADLRAERAQLCAAVDERRELVAQLDRDVHAASSKVAQLNSELAAQTMSVDERARLLDEVDYLARVLDSKQALGKQLVKKIQEKEVALAHAQRNTLYSCMEYNQGLIQVSAAEPELAQIAIDEKELMTAECARAAQRGLERLREARAGRARKQAQRHQRRLQRELQQKELRAKQVAIREEIEKKKREMERVKSAEAAGNAQLEEARAGAERAQLALQEESERLQRARDEATFWKEQNNKWERKLSEMEARASAERDEAASALRDVTRRCDHELAAALRAVNDRLEGVIGKHHARQQ